MIPINRPSIRRKDMDSVLTCMVNDSLGPGERNSELCTAVAHYLGIGGGVALRERGRALSLALQMLELPAGATVMMDPLAPADYHAAVLGAGLVPAYVDVRRDETCMDPGQLEGLDAAAVIVRTALGFVPDLEGFERLGVPIIEDISEGIGANTGERRVGTFGRYVVVGMEPEAIITAGGGTLLLAASKADATRLRRLADELPADNLLPDMNAALALTQVKELERFIARRAELASIFSRALMRGRHAVPGQSGDGENVYFTFPVLLTGSVSDVRQYARKKGVETVLAFRGSVLSRRAEPDSAEGGANIHDGDFTAARALTMRCVRFPLYPSLTAKEVATIERVLTTLP